MKAFIKGTGIISPQQTWGENDFLRTPAAYTTNYLPCIEPDYAQWISPQQLRRMSRVLKMGSTAALMALKDAHLERPDAVITGTGYGCLEDTATFLTRLTDLREEALNPTPFIQSTHNTIGSLIALMLQCQGYNQTYSHSAFSFEQSLLDTLMQLAENQDQYILTGGVDEWTSVSHAIQSRFGKYRKHISNTLSLLDSPAAGTIAGEGAAYFVLTGKQDEHTQAVIRGVRTFYQPTQQQLAEGITSLLKDNSLVSNDIDLVLTGRSGDVSHDQFIEAIIYPAFKGSMVGGFKHLCGEYCTASSFALWLGATILDHNYIPDSVLLKAANRPVRNILIYNTYFHHHHSLILLSSCRDIKS